MSSDAMRPLATLPRPARLGASLHVKGEITGTKTCWWMAASKA